MKNRIYLLLILMAIGQTQVQSQTVVLSPIDDNTLYEDVTGQLSNGAGENMFTGNTASPSIRRALIKFSLSSIPAGATITNVSLKLTMNQTTAPATNVDLHTVDVNWGEGSSVATGGGGGGALAQTNDATWVHTFFSGSTWTTMGGDFNPASSATTNVAGIGNYIWSSAQMITDVQDWLDNPSINFGWIVIGNESVPQTAKRFATKENAVVSSRPQLTVTYTVPCIDPSISNFTASQMSVCPGASTQLTVTGSLNSATTWQLYSVGCGTTPVSSSVAGVFNVSPTVTTSYFVRGIGGCVIPGTCSSLTITVLPLDNASFNYSASSFCPSNPNPTPTITGVPGGTFSSAPAGLSLNSSTGEINLSTSTPGNYTITYTTPGASCVASSNQPITVHQQFATNANAAICDGDNYIFGTQTLTAAGTYNEPFTSMQGCDSIVTLTLSVIQPYNVNASASFCEGDNYIFGTQTLTTPGLYNEVFQSLNGCDSTVNLTLSYSVVDTAVLYASFTLTANSAGAIYQWLDCDNAFAPVPGETNQAFSPANNGNYALVITQNGCTDTSYCHNVNGIGISEMNNTDIRLYPNPAADQLFISAPETIERIDIYGIQGNLILTQQPKQLFVRIDTRTWDAGTYYVRVQTSNALVTQKVTVD